MPTFDVSDHDGYMRLMRYLRRARQRRRITQGDVAAAMETTQSAVSELERGITDPRVATLQRYIYAIGARSRWGMRPAMPHPECQIGDEAHGPHAVRELKDRSVVCYGAPDPDRPWLR